MDIKFRRFIGIAAIITLLNGVSYTLFPAALLPTYGIEPAAGALLGFRFLGAALLTFGLILWFLRLTQDKLAARGLLIGATVGNIVGRYYLAMGDADRRDERGGVAVRRDLCGPARRLCVFSLAADAQNGDALEFQRVRRYPRSTAATLPFSIASASLPCLSASAFSP